MGIVTYTATYTAHTLTGREWAILALVGSGVLFFVVGVVAFVLWLALRKKPGPR